MTTRKPVEKEGGEHKFNMPKVTIDWKWRHDKREEDCKRLVKQLEIAKQNALWAIERLGEAEQRELELQNQLDDLKRENEELRKENAEWEATFELFNNAQTRAVAEWRKQDPEGRRLKLPDMKDLTLWLITELAEARAKMKD